MAPTMKMTRRIPRMRKSCVQRSSFILKAANKLPTDYLLRNEAAV